MADNPRSYQRDVRGRFTKIDIERDVLAPGLGVHETFAYGLEPRHAPDADELAQGGESSPLRPRTARLIGILGDVDQSAPGEPGRRGPYGSPLPPAARMRVEGDDEARSRYGIQGAHVRDAARKSGDPMSPVKHLTGAE